VKVSALKPLLRPDAPARGQRDAAGRLAPLLRAARESGAHLHIDMESLDSREAVLELVLALLDEDEFIEMMERAQKLELRVQEYPGRRTFVATGAGYRVEVHPPREWIDDLLSEADTMRLAGLRLKSEDPGSQAAALADLFDAVMDDHSVHVGEAFVRFVEGGPPGRPQLDGELFA